MGRALVNEMNRLCSRKLGLIRETCEAMKQMTLGQSPVPSPQSILVCYLNCVFLFHWIIFCFESQILCVYQGNIEVTLEALFHYLNELSGQRLSNIIFLLMSMSFMYVVLMLIFSKPLINLWI